MVYQEWKSNMSQINFRVSQYEKNKGYKDAFLKILDSVMKPDDLATFHVSHSSGNVVRITHPITIANIRLLVIDICRAIDEP